MKNSLVEPGRRWPQTDCRLEPPFDHPDNITFHYSAADQLMHKPNELCDCETPHEMSACAYWQQLNLDTPNRAGT